MPAHGITEHIFEIRYGSERFCLTEPIALDVRSEAGHVLASFAPLEIEGYGDTDDEAMESFSDQFGSTWHSVAPAPDADLTDDAREIKDRMLKLVQRVE